MKKSIILSILLLVFSLALSAQVKTVAILETVDRMDNVEYYVKFELRQNLTDAISNTPGYEGFSRADIDQIMREHNFQRTGMVDETQIRQLGRMTGASYILVAEVASSGYNEVSIASNIIDVESGKIMRSTRAVRTKTDGNSMSDACISIASMLLGTDLGIGRDNNVYTSRPEQPQPQTANVITVNVGNVSFEMVKVEAGSFIMGCTSEQSNCYSDENPYHRVVISKDYYIGKFEVTQELYEAVMGVNPSNFKGFDRPVENVSWNDCQEFCAELSRITGRRFRLPTEAEWEYAARGGKKSTSAKFSGSSSVANVAWYTENSGGLTHPVGKLHPNELGIYDMSGNVWEWCQDWYGTYGSNTQTDPQGPVGGQFRVLRGGGWRDNAASCRVAYRGSDSPDSRYNGRGLRVVLVP